MHVRQKIIVSWFSLAVFFALSACSQTPPPDGLREGSLFPSLVLTRLDGKNVSVDSFRGKLVVLNIWATWCAPCRRELPTLERLSHLVDPQRFVIAGLSVDNDILQAREYLIDKGITFASFIDQDMQLATDIFAIRIYPDTLLISPEGVLIRRIAGERVWDDPQIITALEEAYEGKNDMVDAL